jgi:hypothetical protein
MDKDMAAVTFGQGHQMYSFGLKSARVQVDVAIFVAVLL